MFKERHLLASTTGAYAPRQRFTTGLTAGRTNDAERVATSYASNVRHPVRTAANQFRQTCDPQRQATSLLVWDTRITAIGVVDSG